MPRKGSRKPLVTADGVSGTTEPLADYPEASGLLNGQPYWNKRLPWLADVPLCGEHDPKRDPKTDYVYCRVCGFSFGLV